MSENLNKDLSKLSIDELRDLKEKYKRKLLRSKGEEAKIYEKLLDEVLMEIIDHACGRRKSQTE